MSNTVHARKCGRRAPKNAPALHLADFLTGVVPAHPAAADNLARLGGGWAMLGNDVAGDCVSVTWANFRRLVSGRYPDQGQVWTLYKTQNPGFDPNGSASTNGPGSSHDGGMDIQTLLEYLVKVGGPDGVKALGFAKVDHTKVAEVAAAIAIFGAVWTGITVLDANQDQFGQGEPWDYVKGSPVDGGHSVLTGGYGPAGAGPLGGDERFITWAAETSFTDGFWSHDVEECWVVIWPEDLKNDAFLLGVSLAAFAAAWTAITGKVFPVAIPPVPTPTPVPTPVADPADVALAASMKAWLSAKGLG
jgi:hypothetical protein